MSPAPRRRRKRSRPKIGDVIEIATPKGFAYAQFTHDHPMLGEVLRILPGLYASRPADLAALVQQRERYVTYFALRAILRGNEVTLMSGREVPEMAIVGPFPVPARNRPFPLFRSPMLPDPVTGEIPFWTLWDGWDSTTAQRVERLTEAQRDLPPDGLPSYPLFIERIVSGWQPRDDPPPRHVLYFLTELAAQVAAHRLRCHECGYLKVEVQQAPPGSLPPERQWLATAYGGAPPPAAWVAALEAELAAKSERELRAELAAAEQAAPEAEPPEEPPMRHFLYFPTEAAAARAATQLQAGGYTDVAVRPPDSEFSEAEEPPPGTRPLDREWQVVASGDTPPPGEPFGDTREHLEALAEELGGEYDGWEMAVRD